MNNKVIGVVVALIGLFLMPLFTLLTIVPFFLEIYGFPPLIPEFLKELDWHILILVGISIPVYFVLFSFIWAGYKKLRDPSLNVKETLKSIYLKIPKFFIKLLNHK